MMSAFAVFSRMTMMFASPRNALVMGIRVGDALNDFQAPQATTRSPSTEHRCDNPSIAPTRKTCVAALDDFLVSGADGASFCIVFQGRDPTAGPHFSHSVLLDVDRTGAGCIIQQSPDADAVQRTDALNRGSMREMMQIIDDVVDGINVALNLSRITRVECPQPPADECIDVLILTRYDYSSHK